jgi:hypothetical protein
LRWCWRQAPGSGWPVARAAADRALAEQVVEIAPDAAGRAADLAGFSLAAAALIAGDVRQLVDIGAGTPAGIAAVGAGKPGGDAGAAAGEPAGDSVYRVARRVNPGIRLVAVNHDRVVLTHLLAEAGDGSLRMPDNYYYH